jgi:hypothetical protein
MKCKKWFLQPTGLKEFKNFKSCPIGYTGRKRVKNELKRTERRKGQRNNRRRRG